MSGIVGSYFNIKGSGIVAKLGTDGQIFTSTGAGLSQGFEAAAGGGKFASYAVIEDQKSDGTQGGTFTSGSYQIRNLNTEVFDVDGIVSVSSNQFTLAAGSYLIKWFANAKDVNGHQSALYDITASAYIEYGSTEQSLDAQQVTNKSLGSTRVTPSGSNVYEIRHRCDDTDNTEGYGQAANYGNVESYCLVEIYKES